MKRKSTTLRHSGGDPTAWKIQIDPWERDCNCGFRIIAPANARRALPGCSLLFSTTTRHGAASYGWNDVRDLAHIIRS
jgi:hypothetical protein